MSNRPIKVLLGKPGLDGHDQGAKVVARAMMDAGFEVIYTGLRQTPEQIARIALEGGRAIFWRTYLRRYLQLRPGIAAELARWELPVATGLAGRREGRMQRQLLQRVETLVRVSGGKPSSSGSG